MYFISWIPRIYSACILATFSAAVGWLSFFLFFLLKIIETGKEESPKNFLIMMFPQIRCFHSSVNEQPFMFFILSKGDNAGKPGLVPWANCFAVHCSSKQTFDFYFWLVFGLFKAGKFKSRHRGSVISFVNLNDIKSILKETGPAIFQHWQQFQQIMKALDLLEQSKTTLGQQLVTTENLQRFLIRRFFEKYK